jgi:hypothetical protein
VITNVILKPTSPTHEHPFTSFSKLLFEKKFNGIASHSKIFEDIFFLKSHFECSQPRVFAPLQGFPRHDANHQASTPMDK